MALVGAWTRCAICHGLLDRPYTATSGVAFPPNHALFQYCDAPLHLDCLETWPDRREFSRGYFLNALATDWRGGHGTVLRARERWFLASGPHSAGTPSYIRLVLRDWPFKLYSGWADWDAFIEGLYRGDLGGKARLAVDEVMAEVRLAAPTLEALEKLLAAAPPSPKAPRSYVEFGDFLATLWGSEAYDADWQLLDITERVRDQHIAEQKSARAAAVADSNALARQLLLELEIRGYLICPHCQSHSHRVRFIESSPDQKSYFVCQTCGRSFSGSEAAL